MSPFVRGCVRGGALGNLIGGFGVGVAGAVMHNWLLWGLGVLAFLVGRWVWDGTDTPWWRGEVP